MHVFILTILVFCLYTGIVTGQPPQKNTNLPDTTDAHQDLVEKNWKLLNLEGIDLVNEENLIRATKVFEEAKNKLKKSLAGKIKIISKFVITFLMSMIKQVSMS